MDISFEGSVTEVSLQSHTVSESSDTALAGQKRVRIPSGPLLTRNTRVSAAVAPPTAGPRP